MKALVTGATGFVGSHLVEKLLRDGFDVTCLVRESSSLQYLEGLSARFVKGDCTDRSLLKEAVRNADYVFHLAGATKTRCERDSYCANAESTRALIESVAEENKALTRFVYVSTLAAAGPSVDGIPLKEDCMPQPVSIYGKTKLEGERITLSFRDTIPVTIIRPAAVYGPRDRDFLMLFKMVKAGIVPYWGKCYYSLIYVEDLVHAIIGSALNKAGEGETFFLSDGNIYSTDLVYDAIAEAVERRPIKIKMPKGLMPLVGLVAEKVKRVSIINSDKVKEMNHTHWTCDTMKAVSRFNFEPQVMIKEGMRWTADWYRIHQWL